jgi:hypothetical protein
MTLDDPPNSILDSLGYLVNTPSDMWAHVNTQAQMNQAAQAQINRQRQGHMDAEEYLVKPATAATLSVRAREMFLKRMGGIRAELKVAAEDYVHCHIYGETVYLFYCFAGRDGCVKESIDLFPSDQLITQFRMILAT